MLLKCIGCLSMYQCEIREKEFGTFDNDFFFLNCTFSPWYPLGPIYPMSPVTPDLSAVPSGPTEPRNPEGPG